MMSFKISLSSILKKIKKISHTMVTDSQSISYFSNFLTNFIKTTKILVSNSYWKMYVGGRINYRHWYWYYRHAIFCHKAISGLFKCVCVCVCESYDFQLHAVLFDVIPITLGSILTYKVGTSCTQYRTQNILATLLMF